MREKAWIAMSGGVDSSVAAWQMLQEGFDCTGVSMLLYRSTDLGQACHRSCCAQEDLDDAADAAFTLGIGFEVLDCRSLFRERVMLPFCRGYRRGETPNPCIDCNRYLKFDYLLSEAMRQGCRYLATGHYARIIRGENGRWLLQKALDESKDQSYVLAMLRQEQLAHLRFPLGELKKTRVRQIAGELGLGNAGKRDSQDICFVPEGDYGAFLERQSGSALRPGLFLDREGRVLGEHRGAERYTLGQRRGLGVAAGERLYVIGKDMAANTVTLGPEDALYHRSLIAGSVNCIALERLEGPARVTARTRYHQAEQPATALPLPDGRLRLAFDAPLRAMTPGQTVVLYDGDTVVAGGTIREVED